ncbi:hypothetical protein F5887DRAFT_350075 [Amanita rubescens]|nr:hypothetical protein F5887DRAFT_350075 [Amanita rubescens]
MDPSTIIKGSLASIAPFLFPLSLGAAITGALSPIPWSPLSSTYSALPLPNFAPLSWSYSAWLIFILILVIIVFAPTRMFTGPLRFAYLEYASRLISLLVPLLGTAISTFKSIPMLALSALFFLPIAPILFFLFFLFLPTLPLAWQFIDYHYRRRLEGVTASASTINSGLDLAIARALRSAALARTYEKQAFDTVSTTRRTASLTLTLHSTDFFDTAASAWASMGPTALRIEDVVAASREVVDMAENLRQLNDRRVEQVTGILVERANNANAAAVKTGLLARQAQESVASSEDARDKAQEARDDVQNVADKVRTLGAKMAETVKGVEAKVVTIEDEVGKARAILKRAVSVAVEGEIATAEELVKNALDSLGGLVQEQVNNLSSVADEARGVWVELAVNL